ncbi:MAG: hypothetical protein AB7H93_15035 [Vicinamibacterales bacterium]
MRFEARELKDYVEPVPAADLVVGRVYFKVEYADQDLMVPRLDAVVYIGRDLHPGGPGLYFQDVDSYLGGRRFSVGDLEGADVFPLEPDQHSVAWEDDDSRFEYERSSALSDVCEFDDALDQLLACSLRRKTWNGRVRPIAPGRHAE